MAKKISYLGQIVGKYTKVAWENGVKTENTKKYIQLLDKEDTDTDGEVVVQLATIKVTDETYANLKIDSVIEIDVKEFTTDKGIVYLTEITK